MSIELRSAAVSDVPGIRAVATDAWHEAHAPIVGTDTVEAFLAEHYDAASFEERIEREEVVLDVATDDGSVVGYVFALPADDEGTFALAHIYVAPDRWGEGIGRRLLDRVDRAVRDRGGERVRLGVMAANDRAVGFYEAAGYERTDEFYDDRIDTRSLTYEKDLE